MCGRGASLPGEISQSVSWILFTYSGLKCEASYVLDHNTWSIQGCCMLQNRHGNIHAKFLCFCLQRGAFQRGNGSHLKWPLKDEALVTLGRAQQMNDGVSKGHIREMKGPSCLMNHWISQMDQPQRCLVA